MKTSLSNFGNTVVAFVGLGIFIALIICAIIFLSYLFVIGAIIGLILFLIAYISRKLQSKKQRHNVSHGNKQNRTIDQD